MAHKPNNPAWDENGLKLGIRTDPTMPKGQIDVVDAKRGRRTLITNIGEPAAPAPQAERPNRVQCKCGEWPENFEEHVRMCRGAAPAETARRFPIGKCKHCGKDVPDAPKDGNTIIFCSYECYASD